MSQESQNKQNQITPPEWFEYNPDVLQTYDEQVADALKVEEYQTRPLPSFDALPKLDVKPSFNPTNAPEAEIYAEDRVPKKFRALGKTTRREWSPDDAHLVTMWRVLERSALEDGTGLVASEILLHNHLGDVENFKPVKHLSSVHANRMSDPGAATPFVSFSTDPNVLAKWLRSGFGTQPDSDPVIVQVNVLPGRVLTGKMPKTPEVLLIGGVAPEEYGAAYGVEDFLYAVDSSEAARLVERDRAVGRQALPKLIESF